MKKEFVFKPWMIGALRRLSYRWPPKWEVKKRAKIARGIYTCAKCGQPTRNKDIKIDHIKPIIDPEVGFVDWNTFIERMFVPEHMLQALCKTCHDEKSKAERNVRSITRKKKKNG